MKLKHSWQLEKADFGSTARSSLSLLARASGALPFSAARQVIEVATERQSASDRASCVARSTSSTRDRLTRSAGLFRSRVRAVDDENCFISVQGNAGRRKAGAGNEHLLVVGRVLCAAEAAHLGSPLAVTAETCERAVASEGCAREVSKGRGDEERCKSRCRKGDEEEDDDEREEAAYRAPAASSCRPCRPS